MVETRKAKGSNTNPFYQTATVKTPLNHADNGVTTQNLKTTYEYDLPMRKGDVIVLIKR